MTSHERPESKVGGPAPIDGITDEDMAALTPPLRRTDIGEPTVLTGWPARWAEATLLARYYRDALVAIETDYSEQPVGLFVREILNNRPAESDL